MMVTRHIERGEPPKPTQEELEKLWELMVKATVGRRCENSLAAAKRLVDYR